MIKDILDYYQHIPSHIDPIAFSIGSFSVEWYSLMYLVALGTVYLLLLYRLKKDISPENINRFKLPNGTRQDVTRREIRNFLEDVLLVSFMGAIIGGRLGYVILYNPSYYYRHFLEIFSPYDFMTGQFIGIYGMSYHGGFIGAVLAAYLLIRKSRWNFWTWADFAVPAIPAGYFFGRIGNFLNLELYGRVTNSWMGMYFPTASDVGYHLRFPSQLIEAFLEGAVLFVLLWSVRNKKKYPGYHFFFYIIGYGLARFFGEFFREPDEFIGYIFSFLTLGQIFSLLMIVSGLMIPYFQTKRKIV